MYQYFHHNLKYAHKLIAALLLAVLLFSLIAHPNAAFADELPPEEPATEDVVEEVTEEEPEEEEEDSEPKENDGEDGDSGSENDAEGETTVATGDAGAGSNTENQVNTNIVDTESPVEIEEDEGEETGTTTETELPEDNATGTPESASSTVDVVVDENVEDFEDEENWNNEHGTGTEPLADVVVANDNTASTSNTSSTTAGTGNNAAGGDYVTIDTGDAVALSNTVNIVNTNIINSTGFLYFLTEVFGVSSLDLRNAFNIFDDRFDRASCSLSGCDQDNVSMHVTNNNTATITNDVVVRANTGGNEASGNDAFIGTGDAFAAANVLNIANTNIVDANYLLLSFTNFGDFMGDIVLPNALTFADLFNGSGNVGGTVEVNNDNTADIENDVSVSADTGDNTATTNATNTEDGTGGTIVTGDSTAHANVSNYVNTNLFNNDSFMMIFRVHGDWNGDVHGLPDNMAFEYTPGGFTLFNNGQSTPSSNVSDIVVNNNNNAYIHNNVDVAAITGGNSASGGEAGTVVTGDAYAAANVVNVANTNVLGRNWAYLIFDIFGDWNGNISFGQPDLWLGISAISDYNPPTIGSKITYTFTITNFGDVDATGVELAATIDDLLIDFGGDTTWDIGTVAAGATVEVEYTGEITGNLPGGTTPIDLMGEVTSIEEDSNPEDNTDFVSMLATKDAPKRKGGGSRATFPSNIMVTKSIADPSIMPGDTAQYTIVVENIGGPAFYSVLVDTIYNEENEIITEHSWDLGTIFTDEKITITYDVEFEDDIAAGLYQNSAQVFGFDGNSSMPNADEMESNIASVDLTIGDVVVPEVLGVTDDALCERYLHTYMRYGAINDPTEVRKLQTFLNDFAGASVPVTGFFNRQTESAVRAFQSTHANDILLPWGMQRNSGYVYLTTQKKINEMYCDYQIEFPLNGAQLREIDRYKTRTIIDEPSHNNSTEPLPLFGDNTPDKDDNSITVIENEEAIINEVTIRDRRGGQNQTTTPQTVTQENQRDPMRVRLLLRAINWFKDLAQR